MAASAARCILYFADRLGVPADRKALIEAMKQRGAPSISTVAAFAKKLNIELTISKLTPDELVALTVPVMIELADGRFAVVVRDSDDSVTVHCLRKFGTLPMSYATLMEMWTGTVARCGSVEREINAAKPEQASKAEAPLAPKVGSAAAIDPAGSATIGVRTLVRHVAKFKRVLLTVMVASVFVYAVELAIPITFLVIIDAVVGTRASATLDIVILVLVVLTVLGGILSNLSDRVINNVTRQAGLDLSAQFTRHVLSLPTGCINEIRGVEILSRISDLAKSHRLVSNAVAMLSIDLVFIFVCVSLACYFSLALGLIMLVRLPFYFGVALRAVSKLKEATRQNREVRRESMRLIVDTIDGIETVKSRHAEEFVVKRIEQRAGEAVDVSEDGSDIRNMINRYTSMIDRLSTGAILWIGAHQVMNSTVTIGQLMAIYLIDRQMRRPTNRLARAIYDFQQLKIGIGEANRFLKIDPEISSSHLIELPHLKGHIRFDNVRFRYADTAAEILHRVSFDIQPGEIVGIVGPSGSGKSTILKLIQRFYLPTAGRVEIDETGTDILHPYRLREQIGFVPQDCWLFGQTIAENIRLGSPSITETDVIEAARIACAHEFIAKLPKGYDTLVHGAHSLSGGERQRVAIARAIVHRPEIFLLDEPTSSLDQETERRVTENLQAFFKGRTVIIVAHRVSALRHVDKVITVQDGEVREVGTTGELVRAGGYFARMVSEQREVLDAMVPPGARIACAEHGCDDAPARVSAGGGM